MDGMEIRVVLVLVLVLVLVIGRMIQVTHAFDHEKLDVYQLELRFVKWAMVLMEEAGKTAGGRAREACNHLDRASLSCLFNTAEGNGKRHSRLRARFFDDARGSATECAACLDALVAKNACRRERIQEGQELLYRIVSMLTKLVRRFSRDGQIGESDTEYRLFSGDETADEHEDEDEHD